MEDIPYLWPRYFNQEKKDQFQVLNNETQRELEKVIKECPMIDKQFDNFKEDAETMVFYERSSVDLNSPFC